MKTLFLIGLGIIGIVVGVLMRTGAYARSRERSGLLWIIVMFVTYSTVYFVGYFVWSGHGHLVWGIWDRKTLFYLLELVGCILVYPVGITAGLCINIKGAKSFLSKNLCYTRRHVNDSQKD